jgi:hypothetical protein
MPERMLNKVVLPAPLGPMSPTISPSWTAREKSSTATNPPKDKVTFSTSSARGRGSILMVSTNGRVARSLFARTSPPAKEHHQDEREGIDHHAQVTPSTLSGRNTSGKTVKRAAATMDPLIEPRPPAPP